MKIIDDSAKKLHWWNRNYFFAATVFVVLLNIIVFGALGYGWQHDFEPSDSWYAMLDFSNLVRSFLNAFSHGNWQHVLLNMLCFFICGLYLERKEGTLPFLALVFAITFFSSLAATAFAGDVYWYGFSGANFALYAYIIVDYPFMFLRGRNRTKFNIIAGAVVLTLIYLACCFNGGTGGISFVWYPYDFMKNAGHYSGFAAGLVLGLTVQITRLIAEKGTK